MSLQSAEAAVAANPEDERAWQVYSDALQAAGDPRGELIALQAKLATNFDAATLAREQALLEAHAARWLWDGAWALMQRTRLASGDGVPLDIDWKHGFPRRVSIQGVSYRSQVKFPGLGDTWRLLSAQPANVRFVRAVTFGSAEVGDEPDWGGARDAIVEHAPPNLRELSFDRGSYWDISSTVIDGLDADFWAALPRLESLSVELGQIALSDIVCPTLKKFSVVSSSFDEACVNAVRTAKWPALEHLSLYFGDPNYGGLEDPAPVEALLRSTPPPKLRHLGLCNAVFSDAFPGLLLGSAWLPQLTSLDLSAGTLGDEGAAVLLDNADRFRHLKLDLSHGYFSNGVLERLGAAFPDAVLHDAQGESPQDERYVSVSE